MRAVMRSAIGILMTLIIVCAVLGSQSATISARAEERNEYQADLLTETNGDTAEDEGTGKTETAESEPDEESEQGNEEFLDVCFYIRGNGIGADIPEEPGNYSSDLYSSAIRVNGALSSLKYSPSTGSADGSDGSLLSDGFTASNEVSQMLDKLPQASDISAVVDDFDVSRHFVVWYVAKTASTGYPNADVTIHVDGVIRERAQEADNDPDDSGEKDKPANPEDPDQGGEIVKPENPETPDKPGKIVEPEGPAEPDKPVNPESPEGTAGKENPDAQQEDVAKDPIPDVTIEIRALFLEDGQERREIEYDGREHIVGGFEIVISDKETGNPIIGYLYECYGRFIGTRAYADVGLGTEFSYRGQDFWINVVKAFAKVRNPGDSQEVVFYDADDHPLRTAADFIIRDSAGNILPAKFNVIPTTGTVSVRAKNITIEAGTTVKNDDGQTLTDDSFEITSGSLMEGHRIERVVINGSQTGAGRSVNEIAGIDIVDENGNSVNYLYNISTVNGQLILVDTKNGESENTGSNAKASDNSDGAAISYASTIVSVTQTDSGLTATTGNVVPNSLEAAGTYSAKPQVLGARRSETSDAGRPEHARLFILLLCFACGMFFLKNGKHTN